jgi:hypothetical protein
MPDTLLDVSGKFKVVLSENFSFDTDSTILVWYFHTSYYYPALSSDEFISPDIKIHQLFTKITLKLWCRILASFSVVIFVVDNVEYVV